MQANVKDFGAVGDGSTDDTDAIEAAIGSGAYVIYFPSGTYNIARQLEPIEGQQFAGDGSQTVIAQQTANTRAIYVLGISYVTIRDMTVRGGTGSSDGIVCRSENGMNCTDFLIQSVVVQNCGRHGISMEGVRKGRLINVEATNNGDTGVRLAPGGTGFGSSDNTYFYGCFAGANDIGFQVGTGGGSEAQNCRFFGCSAESNDTYGWNILDSPNTYFGCHAEGNGGSGSGVGDWRYLTAGGCSFFGCRSENGTLSISGQACFYSFRGGSITVASSTFEAVLIDCTGTVTDNNGKTVILGSQNSGNLGFAETWKYGGGASASDRRTQITKRLLNTQGVSTSATTILSALPDTAAKVTVIGRETTSGAIFIDEVWASDDVLPVVKDKMDMTGSPAWRDYTRSGTNLQLAMTAGTYDITVESYQYPNPN